MALCLVRQGIRQGRRPDSQGAITGRGDRVNSHTTSSPVSDDAPGPKRILAVQAQGQAAALAGGRVDSCPWKNPSTDQERALQQMWIRGYAQGRTGLRKNRADSVPPTESRPENPQTARNPATRRPAGEPGPLPAPIGTGGTHDSTGATQGLMSAEAARPTPASQPEQAPDSAKPGNRPSGR
ncbi:Rmf/CrpP family protein [Lentzea sp. CA-135723]|uniref:Rmf/CrpP family protein n=1 Tax=Lentzea sp. CA-135723 TaxID=3239950 RepID=UPI003D932461